MAVKLKELVKLSKPARVWINTMLLPVTPDSVKISNNNTSESKQTVEGTPISFITHDKSQKLSMSFFIPIYMDYVIDTSYTFTDSVITNFKFFTDELWRLKENKDPVILTITFADGTSINGKWVIFDYDYTIDASKGSDIYFNISFEEFYPAENQEINTNLQNLIASKGLRG